MSTQVLLFLAVFLAIYGVYLEWQRPRRRLQAIMERAEALRQGQVELADDSPVKRLARIVLPRLQPWLPTLTVDYLRWRLLWAGRPGGFSAEEFYFLKLALALGLGAAVPVLSLFQGGSILGQALLFAGAGYMLPDLWLKQRIAQREAAIQADLPVFISILTSAMEAGLPLYEAVRQVAIEVPGLLSAEMLRTTQEIAAGKPVQQAWKNLMDRSTSRDLKAVVTGILQSQEYGVPIAEQLRRQMEQVRTDRRQRAQQRNQAALVKMRVPMVLFILVPTMFMILGPGVMEIARQFKGGMP